MITPDDGGTEIDPPAALKTQDSPKVEEEHSFFQGAAGRVVRPHQSELPRSLYHYTSSEGLLGIISTNTLRFSDTSFVNDGSENSVSLSAAAHAIERFLVSNPHIEREVGERLMRHIHAAVTTLIPVVFCMSRQNNLLNQWRDYGKDVVPYCIELETSELLTPGFIFPTFLVEVVYSWDRMLSMCEELFTEIEKQFSLQNEEWTLTDELLDRLYDSAAMEFVLLALRFKNPAFEAEQEWRLVTTTVDLRNAGIARRYRTSNLGVVPYYEWRSGDGGKLPIRKVTVGPSPYAQVTDLALKQFLADHHYEIDTSYSTIPLRK